MKAVHDGVDRCVNGGEGVVTGGDDGGDAVVPRRRCGGVGGSADDGHLD